jgi:hypothetical protein
MGQPVAAGTQRFWGQFRYPKGRLQCSGAISPNMSAAADAIVETETVYTYRGTRIERPRYGRIITTEVGASWPTAAQSVRRHRSRGGSQKRRHHA